MPILHEERGWNHICIKKPKLVLQISSFCQVPYTTVCCLTATSISPN